MKVRERGNIWPIISVITGALFVLVVMPFILHRQSSGQMATVDAQVSIGDSSTESIVNPGGPSYRWPDTEVPRTAERLRDLTAVAIAATSNVVEDRLYGRTANAGEILQRIAQRQLVPAEWLTQQPGVLQTHYGTIHLRYAPQALTLEVLSVPNDRKDGPAMLVRIPDPENTGVGLRYFESLQVDGVVYPHPFAPITDIIAAGWQPRLFKQTQIPDEQRAQLEEWLRSVTPK